MSRRNASIMSPLNERGISIGDFQRQTGETDDTGRFTRALSASNGRVVVPAGTYTLSSDITVPDNTDFGGMGADTIIKTNNRIVGGNNTTIHDFYLTTATAMSKNASGIQPYPQTNPYTAIQATIYFGQNKSNCKVCGITGDGVVVEFDAVTGFAMHDCDFKAGYSVTGGLQTFNGSNSGRVYSNRIGYASTNGFGFNDSYDITLQGNEAYSNGNSGFFMQNGSYDLRFLGNSSHDQIGNDGFDLNPGNMSDVRRIIAVGNHSWNNPATGMYINGSFNVVQGNILHDNGTNGLRVVPWNTDTSTGTNLNVQDNMVYNNNTAANASGSSLDHECLIENMQGGNVGGNVFTHTTGTTTGYMLYMAGYDFTVMGNTAVNPTSAAGTDWLLNAPPTGKANMTFGNRHFTADNMVGKLNTLGSLVLDSSQTDEVTLLNLKNNSGIAGGAIAMQIGSGLSIDWQGIVHNAGAVYFAAFPAGAVPNNSIYVDSADNKLKFKDSAGTVTILAS